jgi:GxxExxY protein
VEAILKKPQRTQSSQSRSYFDKAIEHQVHRVEAILKKPQSIPSSQSEMMPTDSVTEAIISAAIEVHRCLGPGLLEAIYEEALCVEFDLRGIDYERQVPIEVVYKGHRIKGEKLDLLVEKQVIVELKSLSKLPEFAFAQVISYLKAAGLKRGLLINFGQTRLVDGVKRISV